MAVAAGGSPGRQARAGARPRGLADRAADRQTARRAAAEPFAIHDAMVELLSAASQTRGLLIVLEDVQLADEPSLALLEHVALQLHDRRIMVAGHRAGAAAGGSPRQDARGSRATGGLVPTPRAPRFQRR